MTLTIIREVLLLPFKCLYWMYDNVFFASRLGERDRQELDLRRKVGQQETVIHGLADQNVFLQDKIQEAERDHKAEMDNMEAHYQKRIKELQRQLDFERLKKGSQP